MWWWWWWWWWWWEGRGEGGRGGGRRGEHQQLDQLKGKRGPERANAGARYACRCGATHMCWVHRVAEGDIEHAAALHAEQALRGEGGELVGRVEQGRLAAPVVGGQAEAAAVARGEESPARPWAGGLVHKV